MDQDEKPIRNKAPMAQHQPAFAQITDGRAVRSVGVSEAEAVVGYK